MDMMTLVEPGAVAPVMVSEQELAQLYRTEGPQLVGLARLLLRDSGRAEEIVQDVFERLLRRRPSFDSQPEAYLRRAVVNACRDDGRRKLRGIRIGERFPERGDESAAGADTAWEANERATQVRAAVEALPSPQRECVALRFFMANSTSEIAEILGIPDGTVKSHIHRAMGRLQHAMGDLR